MKNEVEADRIKILLCCHKMGELPTNPNGIFLPIQVGAVISDVNLGIQRDDQLNGKPCDNISAKNKNYCELTAMYWAWKNLRKIYPNVEYVGLNHYRRYFDFDKKIAFDYQICKNESDIKFYKINLEKLSNILHNHCGIISKLESYPYSIEQHYGIYHMSEDFRVLEKVVLELYPSFKSAFEISLKCSNIFSPCNMFILKIEDFENYCEWLFNILEECEKRIPYQVYNNVQGRIFGYMAERLLNVYIFQKKMDVKKLPVYLFSERKNDIFFSRFCKHFRHSLSWWFQFPLCLHIKWFVKKILSQKSYEKLKTKLKKSNSYS